MTPPVTPPNDAPRDAHLLAALRHAPDRDLLPPERLSAAILGEAEAAVRSRRARAADATSGWRAAWSRFWQPAPMAAFGTIAMATLIGVMWGGRDVPEPAPTLRPQSAVKEKAPAAAAAPAPAAASGAESAMNDEVSARAAPQRPADKAAAQESKRDARGGAEPESASKKHAAKDSRRAAPLERDSRDAQEAGRVAEPFANPSVPMAPDALHRQVPLAVTPPPAPAPAAAPPPAAAAALGETAARKAEARSDALAKSLADNAAHGPQPAQQRGEIAALRAAPALALSPLAAVNAEIEGALGSDASRVRWRLAGDRLAAHEAAQREAWSALSRATQGRWQREPARQAGAGDATPVTLLIDGAVRGSLGFEPQAAVWRDAAGTLWRAPLAADTARELQAAVARW